MSAQPPPEGPDERALLGQIQADLHLVRHLVQQEGPDIFLSFVYAAAVHIVIVHLLQRSAVSGLSAWSFAVVALLLVFLAIDWITRVRMREQLPEEFPLWAVLGKLTLEVTGVFCLTLTFAFVIELHAGPNAPGADGRIGMPVFRLAAASYALLSCAWNALVFQVMRDLAMSDVAVAAWKGTVMGLKGVEQYAQGCVYARARQAGRALDERWDGYRPSTGTVRGLCRVVAAVGSSWLGTCLRRGVFWSIGELVAGHVTVVHALVGVRLLLGFARSYPTNPWASLGLRDGVPEWLFLIMAVTAMLFLFAFGHDRAAAFMFCVYVVGFVFLVPLEVTLVIHAFQQVVVSVVLQFTIVRQAPPTDRACDGSVGGTTVSMVQS